MMTLALAVFISAICHGQMKGTSMLEGDWSLGSTISNHFVQGFSTAGTSIGYSVFVKDNFAVGLGLGSNNYWQYVPTSTYNGKAGARTTDMYKYIFTMPITVTTTRYFHIGHYFSPYFKSGIGAEYSEQNLYYNVFETTHNNWGFVMSSEVGVRIVPVRYSRIGFNLGFSYQHATNSAPQYNINNIQAYNIKAGLSWNF